MRSIDDFERERGVSSRFLQFQDLMRHRVRDILLVSSLYDSYILSEDGSFYESLLSEYVGFGLTQIPQITRVSNGAAAIELAGGPNRFDLIITSLHLGDMHALDLSRRLRELGVVAPIVVLTYDTRELNELVDSGGATQFDKVFIWQGEHRIFLAIIKSVEDRLNIRDDTALVGVQTIILIEDNVKFYSSYLPQIYTAVFEHTQALISEGVNPAHKLLRMRARPKIILCSTYEEAWEYFEKYHETVLGVISDIEFPRGGAVDAQAGFEFVREVRKWHADIPVLLQSQDVSSRAKAEALGVSFLLKDSATLLRELRQFMIDHFGFGDFVFRLRDGTIVGRASDLRSLEAAIQTVPDESLEYHGERNDFSKWLKARSELLLAFRLRPVKLSDFQTKTELRPYLIDQLQGHRHEQHLGSIVYFDPATYDETRSFARVGLGSLGGKARGLGFASSLISTHGLGERFNGVLIAVPPSVILGSDVFDLFLSENGLLDFAIRSTDDEEILLRFLQARFPPEVTAKLDSYLAIVREPLSVRSSSLLEDSRFMPFAGVYDTHMVPNNHRERQVRLRDLVDAVKRVYASTFYQTVKSYIKTTPYRLEEEKMAVVVQKLVGTAHGRRFYPDLSGVARSYNFYPITPMAPADGIASVALGLGKTVVEGGPTVRFCPRFPRHVVHFATVEDVLKYSQKEFLALELPDADAPVDARLEPGRGTSLVRCSLEEAEADGALAVAGSTYSRENHAIYDGVSRKGVRLVTLAPILKNDLLPLPQILDQLLDLCSMGMNSPVEIEFAVKMSGTRGKPAEFYLLQVRPMVVDQELERLSILETHPDDLICRSSSVLGNGTVRDIHDVVVVDHHRFNRGDSVKVAAEVRNFNMELVDGKIPYLLIGVGRWGSADPWLGIPVRWQDINGARIIVEAALKDVKVAPSQGTHFFQNITSSKIGYITVHDRGGGFVDWDWLAGQTAVKEVQYTRHLRFDRPISIFMDGHRRNAIILKPGANEE